MQVHKIMARMRDQMERLGRLRKQAEAMHTRMRHLNAHLQQLQLHADEAQAG